MSNERTIEQWEHRTHTHDSLDYPFHVRGSGPAVVLVHELYGISAECVKFGNRLVEAGFRVYMPQLFGPVGHLSGKIGVTAGNLAHICISREWNVFRSGRTSPVIRWVRSMCHLAHTECGGPGVGAIGMCLTGNFALTLFATGDVLAPVLSQPSIPATPLMPWNRSRMDISEDDLEAAKQRATAPSSILGFRFQGDKLCAAAKFERLRNEFGEAFESHELPDAGPTHHSVFTADFIDKEGHPTRLALARVVEFLKQKLIEVDS